jgi:beta-N-acetylhexosaminidase
VLATFITDIQGPELTALEEKMLTNDHLGGIILFTRHFESMAQLKSLTQQITLINPKLIITVDHEGGRVQRFRDGFTLVPAMGRLGELYKTSPQAAKQAAKACAVVLAGELMSVGVHLTYAPVLDINYGRNVVIGDRGFSMEPMVISELAEQFSLGLKEMSFAVVGKHFPGHGWVNLDSHVACPVDERSFNDIQAADIQPFKKLLPQIDWMMPAHVVYSQVDNEPAGFSKIWLQDILKQSMGYKGRIVSDDLSMAGAAVKGGFWQRGKAAMEAGCDILLACNSSAASIEILAGMEKEGVMPMSLAQYIPTPLMANPLKDDRFLKAKKSLHKLGLIA